MKTKYLFLTFALLICISMSYAQQADRIQRGQRGYTPPPLERVAGSKTIINTLVDIDEKMDFYEAELPLDAFEKEVLKNMIVDFEDIIVDFNDIKIVWRALAILELLALSVLHCRQPQKREGS